MHKLIDPAYVRNLKLSPSYNEATFAAEYLGIRLGGSDESWFNYEKLTKYRKLANPEWKQKFVGEKNVFYLISVDVGRLHDQTVACIWRINIRDNKYYTTLVNLFVLGRQAETKTFTQ
jgi:predicted phosphoadenosine phosphosulfate sulfurtransferase